MIKHLKPRTEEEIQDMIETEPFNQIIKLFYPDKIDIINKELSRRLNCNAYIHNVNVFGSAIDNNKDSIIMTLQIKIK